MVSYMPRIRLDILPDFVIVKKLLYIDASGRRKVSQRTITRGGLFEARRIPRGRDGKGRDGGHGTGGQSLRMHRAHPRRGTTMCRAADELYGSERLPWEE